MKRRSRRRAGGERAGGGGQLKAALEIKTQEQTWPHLSSVPTLRHGKTASKKETRLSRQGRAAQVISPTLPLDY